MSLSYNDQSEEIIYKTSDFPSSYQLFQKVIEDLLILPPDVCFDIIVKKRKILKNAEDYVDIKKTIKSITNRKSQGEPRRKKTKAPGGGIRSKIEEN